MQKGVNLVYLVKSFPTNISYLLAKIRIDTAENEPFKVCRYRPTNPLQGRNYRSGFRFLRRRPPSSPPTLFLKARHEERRDETVLFALSYLLVGVVKRNLDSCEVLQVLKRDLQTQRFARQSPLFSLLRQSDSKRKLRFQREVREVSSAMFGFLCLF